MGFLGGGSKSSSSSYNQNNALLTGKLDGVVDLAGNAGNAISNLLSGDMTGFNTFKNNAGYNIAAQQGTQGILGSAAARGLLRSGASGKALVNYGDQLTNQYLQNYMQNLLGLGGLGINAGNVLAGSGQISQSSDSKKGGLGGFLGGIAGGIARSDRNSKTDIKKLGEFSNGMGKYSFRYKSDPTIKHVGVMADEVAIHFPEALGPVVDNYQTVDYDKLKELMP